MSDSIQSLIKTRALIIVLFIHLGLGLGIFALARTSFPDGWDLTSSLFLGSILSLYGGFILALAFVLIPLVPWLKRVQNVEHWAERLARDMPIILDQIPKAIAIYQSIKTLPSSKAPYDALPDQTRL